MSSPDSIMASGITGAHPNLATPLQAEPGIRDTGKDSRVTSGSDMELPSQSSQRSQEVSRPVSLSTRLGSLDSEPPSALRLFQDAKSELVNLPLST